MSAHADRLVQHIRHRDLRSDTTLHVVGVISNPHRFQARTHHAREWLERMSQYPNVKPYIVEATFKDREWEVAEVDNPQHLRLITRDDAWIKESMINLGVRRLLPFDWKYMAWSDIDIDFREKEWGRETCHALQHHHLVQPWESSIDLKFRGGARNLLQSFGFVQQQNIIEGRPFSGADRKMCDYNGGDGHTGYAWACTREFFERVGGLIDFAIFGSGDWHMAYAAVGHGEMSLARQQRVGGYHRRVLEWQHRAMQLTHGELGFVHGHIEHSFHGNPSNRRYGERWKVLVKHGYDPDTDLIWDAQGLVQLAGNKPALQSAIRAYNRLRQEDDTREE